MNPPLKSLKSLLLFLILNLYYTITVTLRDECIRVLYPPGVGGHLYYNLYISSASTEFQNPKRGFFFGVKSLTPYPLTRASSSSSSRVTQQQNKITP